MRGLLANLTTAAVLIHALLGCCWHHGHTCTESDATAGIVAYDGHHHTAEACLQHEESSDSDEHSAPHRHACDEGACVAVKAGAPSLDLALAWLTVARVYAESAPLRLAGDTAFSTAAPLSPTSTLPTRLHLFLGLLLV